MADLRTELAGWADDKMQALPERRTPVAHGKAELLAELRALLASSAPATASEGATELTGDESYVGDPCPEHGPHCHGDICCCADKHRPAAGVTSSDGDRGLSEEERRSLGCQCWRLDGVWHHVRGCPAPAVERILAARTAQPEGVERVEWGVRGAEDNVFAVSENREWVERWLADPAVLIRRTVTEYAPVVGPWEVVGDE